MIYSIKTSEFYDDINLVLFHIVFLSRLSQHLAQGYIRIINCVANVGIY